MKKDFRSIAKIVKPHKLNGAVKAKLFDYKITGNSFPNYLYIDTENPPLPFFIEQFDAISDNEFIVRFEDWISREAVLKSLRGKSILIDKNDAAHNSIFQLDENKVLKYLTGYLLKNAQNEAIGKIEAVYDVPENKLAGVMWKGEEVLIPLNEALIVETNDALKTITVEIPDGLLSLNDIASEEE